ncbi:MAG: ABC transporter permease [Gemmatimonadales bacterium]
MAPCSYSPAGPLGTRMSGLGWAVRSLIRQRLRTALAVIGIAISAAMLLDMVMLSGGIEKSFAELLLAKGYQIRLTPKGTLPFDTEATLDRASSIVARLRRDTAIASAGAVLGTSLYGRSRDSLVTLVGYGIQPEAQGVYQVQRGQDLARHDTIGVLLSAPAAGLLRAEVGGTVSLLGRLDPQVATAGVSRQLVVRGIVRWVYDYRGQPSVGTILPVMQALAAVGPDDRASLVLVKARNDAAAPALAERLRQEFPRLEVYSVADLVRFFKQRLVYFRQLSYILATMSLVVTVLLITTLLTITVNERLGEIATLRAIGIGRSTVVRQVFIEGAVLTVLGAVLGIALGLGTARYLDSILTSFPGLPAAFSFFVPRRETLTAAALVLLVTGSLAGLYPAWLAARAPIAATLRSEAT